eukprot:bmy_17978T0
MKVTPGQGDATDGGCVRGRMGVAESHARCSSCPGPGIPFLGCSDPWARPGDSRVPAATPGIAQREERQFAGSGPEWEAAPSPPGPVSLGLAGPHVGAPPEDPALPWGAPTLTPRLRVHWARRALGGPGGSLSTHPAAFPGPCPSGAQWASDSGPPARPRSATWRLPERQGHMRYPNTLTDTCTHVPIPRHVPTLAHAHLHTHAGRHTCHPQEYICPPPPRKSPET